MNRRMDLISQYLDASGLGKNLKQQKREQLNAGKTLDQVKVTGLSDTETFDYAGVKVRVTVTVKRA